MAVIAQTMAALGVLSIAGLLHFIGSCLYNIYFHPLSRYPGPRLWAASQLPWTYHVFKGDLAKPIIPQLHEKYGRVVRIAPDRLIYADASAWRDLYVHKSSTGQQNPRDPSKFLPAPKGGINSMLLADDQSHARFRSFLSPAFSTKAMDEQRDLVNGYVTLLIKGLAESTKEGPQDLMAWLNWTSFDIIGDLCFGESFEGLVKRREHPWIYFIFHHITTGLMVAHLSSTFPWTRRFLPYLSSNKSLQSRLQHRQMTIEKVKSRIDRGETDRPDIITLALREGGKEAPLSLAELVPNMMTLIIAGSETTAGALAGALYLLCRNHHVYRRLMADIRTAFAKDGDIDIYQLNKLEYLTAVIREALRLYPPVPTEWHRRIADPAGQLVAGEWVPYGTFCGVAQYAANRYKPAFRDADSFIPERWLGDAKYAADELELVQPFAIGPRNCLGQSLAYMEMRLILARLLYNFDFTLSEPDRDWIDDQSTFGLWKKLPLMMHVVPVSSN
ncbi:hypothetical protein PRZ48_002293 [Zasmidium cellare]|uniref:Cytochrome P450 n=1 Tax=Zasmidium cellare TaxID=395010 RepID=A0ABR0F3M2_ZASCE|nr:hypothetical protein PRZ48_002293 [Zasmidium cellare]